MFSKMKYKWKEGNFSLRFWSGYLHQPEKYYNASLIRFIIYIILMYLCYGRRKFYGRFGDLI